MLQKIRTELFNNEKRYSEYVSNLFQSQHNRDNEKIKDQTIKEVISFRL